MVIRIVNIAQQHSQLDKYFIKYMSINTKLTILLAVVFLICTSVVIYFVLQQNKSSNNTPIKSGNSGIYSEEQLKQSAIKSDMDILTLADQPDFYITYSLTAKEFIIELTPQDLSTDYNQLRLQAEDSFLNLLKIGDKQKLCGQNISVLVPPSYKPEYSGFNYGLSFCTGSLKF